MKDIIYTKYFKRSIKITLIILILISSIFVTGSNLFQNSLLSVSEKFGYLRYAYLLLIDFDNLRNEFNFKKLANNRSFSYLKHQVKIDLSYDDITALSQSYRIGLKNGYLVDSEKKWRKINITIGQQEYKKVGLKIHGTSLTPFANSLGLIGNYNLNNDTSKNWDPNIGGFSYKIKFSKNIFYNNKRRMVLLSRFDEWNAASSALNKYAKSMDIVTTVGKPVILYPNGKDAGVYYFAEDLSKEYLERDYKITNYAIFKSNDDWNKSKGISHSSTTDYSSFDKEQTGIEKSKLIGQLRLRKLFNAINNKNIQEVLNLIEIDNFAKIFALQYLYGTNHSTYGDNRRYLYNITTGKFSLIYRVEGSPIKLKNGSILEFNTLVQNSATDKLTALLNTSNEFLDKRNFFLKNILNQKEDLIKMLDKERSIFKNVFKKTTRSNDFLERKDSQIKQVLNYNFKKIKNYLKYTKVYITHSINKNFIELIHDSYTPSAITGYLNCSEKKINFPNKIYLNANYNSNFKDEDHIYKIDVEETCIKSLIIEKNYTKNFLDYKHIYLNQQIYDQTKFIKPKVFFKQNLIEKIIKKRKTWEIKSGTYIIDVDIKFPKNVNVIINKGTKFLLHKNKSIVFNGNLTAIGSKEDPITINAKTKNNFGTFSVLGQKNNIRKVDISYLNVSNGSEAIIEGVYFSSQFSVHFGKINVENSTFENSSSDDGINFKNSRVNIENNVFKNNKMDQIDLDFCNGILKNNKFYNDKEIFNQLNAGDGLDLSGSNITITDNSFKNFSDKAISVGEKSNVNISENILQNNYIGIAVKDESYVKLNKNKYVDNITDVSKYIKKHIFKKPIIESNETQKIKILDN